MDCLKRLKDCLMLKDFKRKDWVTGESLCFATFRHARRARRNAPLLLNQNIIYFFYGIFSPQYIGIIRLLKCNSSVQGGLIFFLLVYVIVMINRHLKPWQTIVNINRLHYHLTVTKDLCLFIISQAF